MLSHMHRKIKNIEKYITFLITVQKKEKNGKKITYKIRFISSIKFMASLLLNLVDNLADELHKM